MLAGMVKRFHDQYHDWDMNPRVPISAKPGAGSSTTPTYLVSHLQQLALRGYDKESDGRNLNLEKMRHVGK